MTIYQLMHAVSDLIDDYEADTADGGVPEKFMDQVVALFKRYETRK